MFELLVIICALTYVKLPISASHEAFIAACDRNRIYRRMDRAFPASACMVYDAMIEAKKMPAYNEAELLFDLLNNKYMPYVSMFITDEMANIANQYVPF